MASKVAARLPHLPPRGEQASRVQRATLFSSFTILPILLTASMDISTAGAQFSLARGLLCVFVSKFQSQSIQHSTLSAKCIPTLTQKQFPPGNETRRAFYRINKWLGHLFLLGVVKRTLSYFLPFFPRVMFMYSSHPSSFICSFYSIKTLMNIRKVDLLVDFYNLCPARNDIF